MREIKFRAWNKDLEQWDYFTPANIPTYLQTLMYHNLNGSTLYPFTGLEDSEGQEIYEGDILQWDYCIFTVKWDRCNASFFGQGKLDNEIRGDLRANLFSDSSIIGHIYENTEVAT